MAFPSPPPAPQRGDRATFSQRVDAFLTWLVALIPLLNNFLSSISALAAGGANSFSYAIDTSLTDANPGAGKVRLNSATQNAATIIRVSTSPANGGDISAFMVALQAGTSSVKGSLRLQQLANVNSYLLFDITSVTQAAGYFNLSVVPRASTSNSPFAANDTVSMFVDQRGDRGDGGNTPTAQEMRDAIGTLPVANGGTGATTAAVARSNLDVPANSAVVLKFQDNYTQGTRFLSSLTPSIGTIISSGQGDKVPFGIGNGGNNGASAVMQFIRDGQFGVYFGLDTDNKLKVGGFSMGQNAYEIYHTGNLNPAAYAQLSGASFTGAIYAPAVVETSDETLKHNWRRLTDAQLDALAALEKVGVFDWIDGGGSALGGSAQAIRAIVPEAVHEDKNGKLSVAYGGLTFAMAQGALRRASR